jgi:hypothetical protein
MLARRSAVAYRAGRAPHLSLALGRIGSSVTWQTFSPFKTKSPSPLYQPFGEAELRQLIVEAAARRSFAADRFSDNS